MYIFLFMENQTSPVGTDNFNPSPDKKPRPLRPILIGLGVVVLVFILWYVYLVFFSPAARRDFETRKNYEQAMRAIGAYEDAMRNDTYGGKTPQETLNLFIDALEKEDVELASKYFVLRDDGSQDLQWLEGLKRAKEENKIQEFIDVLVLSQPDLKARISEEYYVFVSYNKNGEIILELDLRFNKYSGIWKIENL